MTTWYVLLSSPMCERRVERDMATELGLLSYVPYEKFEVRRASGPVTIETPLMRGYVFAGTKSGRMPWRAIGATRHVRGWLRMDGDIPAPVSDLEVDHIRLLAEKHNSTKAAQRASLQPGDRVRVSEGPFASMTTLLDAIRGKSGTVTITLLGGPQRVHIPMEHLERVA